VHDIDVMVFMMGPALHHLVPIFVLNVRVSRVTMLSNFNIFVYRGHRFASQIVKLGI